MKHSSLSKSARLVATLVAITFSTPLFAQTSGQGADVACDVTMMSGSIAQLSATHATVNTSILIDTAAADVWITLTDFEAMADWSTGTLQGMTGDIQNGGRVVIPFLFGADENGDPIANEIPHTLINEDGEKIGWSDPFLADIGGGHDNHIYHVLSCGDKTLFVQSDEIERNPYAANFVTQLLPMYQLFNAELKTTAENR